MKTIRCVVVAGAPLLSGMGFANAVFPVGSFTIYGKALLTK